MAVDAEVLSLAMPPHPHVRRFCGDLCDLPFPDASYDYWVCVSVLEHMALEEKRSALAAALWLLKPGGYALLTTDETEPALLHRWLEEAGFALGPLNTTPPQEPLSPRVAWAIAQKP